MTHQAVARLGAAVVTVFVAGCASTMSNELSNDLALAQSAISEAEEAGAAESSPVELGEARDRLQAANGLAEDGDYERAEWRAEEATADAELAEAKARSEQTAQAVQEIQQDLAALRREAFDEE